MPGGSSASGRIATRAEMGCGLGGGWREPLAGRAICEQATRNFRAPRKLGVSVRNTIDTIIATCRIESGYVLPHRDRDFDAFEDRLGLRVARAK